jgi:hypothetical protein
MNVANVLQVSSWNIIAWVGASCLDIRYDAILAVPHDNLLLEADLGVRDRCRNQDWRGYYSFETTKRFAGLDLYHSIEDLVGDSVY